MWSPWVYSSFSTLHWVPCLCDHGKELNRSQLDIFCSLAVWYLIIVTTRHFCFLFISKFVLTVLIRKSMFIDHHEIFHLSHGLCHKKDGWGPHIHKQNWASFNPEHSPWEKVYLSSRWGNHFPQSNGVQFIQDALFIHKVHPSCLVKPAFPKKETSFLCLIKSMRAHGMGLCFNMALK